MFINHQHGAKPLSPSRDSLLSQKQPFVYAEITHTDWFESLGLRYHNQK